MCFGQCCILSVARCVVYPFKITVQVGFFFFLFNYFMIKCKQWETTVFYEFGKRANQFQGICVPV